jgi:hypothetical protein
MYYKLENSCGYCHGTYSTKIMAKFALARLAVKNNLDVYDCRDLTFGKHWQDIKSAFLENVYEDETRIVAVHKN